MKRVVAVAVPDTRAVGLHIVTGVGQAAPGAHTCLAIKVSDLVRQAGFWAVGLHTSKFRHSHSRYIDFKDAFGRMWCIRVSDHLRPLRGSIPHLDLISADGIAGIEDTREFLALVVAGDVLWFDSAATAVTVSEPTRKRIARCR